MKTKKVFGRFAQKISNLSGHPVTFILAVTLVIVWALTGPVFQFNETWQLVINTGTTIITFLMVFLIQSTQNRDTAAMHLKLDELIRATQGAHTILLDLEELEEDQLEKIRDQYEEIASKARKGLKQQETDTGRPHIDIRQICDCAEE